MDQQKYDWLAAQRQNGQLDYDTSMAFDAAQSRGEFQQFQGQPAAPPADQGTQGNVAVVGPLGGSDTPTTTLPTTSTTTTTQPPNVATGPGVLQGPNNMMPSQGNLYEQAQPHNFVDDLGIPNEPRYIGHLPELAGHPDLARIRNALDFTPEGRQLSGGAPAMARTLGGAAWNLLPSTAAQLPKSPGGQDAAYYMTQLAQAWLLQHLLRSGGGGVRQWLANMIAARGALPNAPSAAAPPAAAPPQGAPPQAPPPAIPPQGPQYPPPGGQWWH